MPKLTGEDINVSGCRYTAEGDTPGEVLRLMVEHLNNEHGMDLPDPETILAWDEDETQLDRGDRLALERMRERLGVTKKGLDEPKMDPIRVPPIGQ